MGSTGLPSGGVGVVLSTLCGGIRVRPYTICATARRPGKANQKEDGAGAMVCVYPQRARRIHQLGRVPGESEEAPGERHTVSMSATADPSAGRSSFASGVSYLRQMWPPHACGISQTARASVSGLHLWTCGLSAWRTAMPAHLWA